MCVCLSMYFYLFCSLKIELTKLKYTFDQQREPKDFSLIGKLEIKSPMFRLRLKKSSVGRCILKHEEFYLRICFSCFLNSYFKQ